MSRRRTSLHHNLGDKNIVFHSEHRSKKGRKNRSKVARERIVDFKKKKLETLTKELDHENFNL